MISSGAIKGAVDSSGVPLLDAVSGESGDSGWRGGGVADGLAEDAGGVADALWSAVRLDSCRAMAVLSLTASRSRRS